MRTTSSVALAVVLSLAAAGCGSSKSTTSATTAAAAATTAAAAAAPAATTTAAMTEAPSATTAAPATTTAAATTAAPAATTARAGASTDVSATKNITVAMITQGDAGRFWSVVQQGAEQAGADLGITVRYQGAASNVDAQAQMIDKAVADKVWGVALSLVDSNVVNTSAAKISQAGIPLVTLNSGVGQYREVGAVTHIGQSEREAGRGAGQRLKAAGAKVMLCVMQETGNVGIEDRCKGAAETFAPGTVTNLTTTGGETPEALQREVRARLQSDTSIDSVVATDPSGAVVVQNVAVELSRKIKIGAIDVSEPLLTAIENGGVAFTIDQQQYNQGYFAVVVLYLAITKKNALGVGLPVAAGPSIVDRSNVVAVKDLFVRTTR
jgi:simple sugar transport system substrate-binding protein